MSYPPAHAAFPDVSMSLNQHGQPHPGSSGLGFNMDPHSAERHHHQHDPNSAYLASNPSYPGVPGHVNSMANYFNALPAAAAYPPAPGGGLAPEAPVYVNAKQYQRILKRREVRKRLSAASSAAARRDKKYAHESRHRHAMKRPRGEGGRFLSKAEKDALRRSMEAGGGGGSAAAPGAPGGPEGGPRQGAPGDPTSQLSGELEESPRQEGLANFDDADN